MTIELFEQSGCILTSEGGFKLAIDIGALTAPEKLLDIEVDAMLVSHIHADHCGAEQIVALNPTVLYTGAECLDELNELELSKSEIVADNTYTIDDFTVEVFEVDHGPNAPRVPEQNFGFLITEGEESLYFAGDMFAPSGIDVSELSVAHALLPVGGHFTFDAQAAYDFAKTFKSVGTLWPVHFEAVGPIDTKGGETFKALAAEDFSVQL